MKKFILSSIILFISAFAFGQSIILDPTATGQGKLRVKTDVNTLGSFSSTQTQSGLDFRNNEPSNGDGSQGNLIGGIGTSNHDMLFYTHADYSDGNMFFSTPSGSNGNIVLRTQNFDRLRITPSGTIGIGISNPTLSGLVVAAKVGNSHAIFGPSTAGVSIESNFPGIHFNSYFNGTRKMLSVGYTSGAEMNASTGTFAIYTSPVSTLAGNTASVFNRFSINKNGYIKLGDDVATTPAIKTKKIIGMNGSSTSITPFTHDLTQSKIISVSIFISESVNNDDIPPHSTFDGVKYDYYVTGTSISIQNLGISASSFVANRPVRIYITYEE